jgi:carbon-monoxide dehydrogenase medium subunit
LPNLADFRPLVGVAHDCKDIFTFKERLRNSLESAPAQRIAEEPTRVKPAPFAYHCVHTLPDAVQRLAQIAPEDGRVLAGGQTLLPAMALRMARPQHLLDINRIASLNRIAESDGTLAIGACVRHAAFHRIVTANPLGRLMQVVVPHIAHYPIRSRGTFCGSIATADPASEWCCVAATLDAEMIAESVRGRRTIKADSFFQGMMTTELAPDELLTEVRLPLLAPGTCFGFQEFSRRHGDYAMSMALVTFQVVEGRIVESRVGIGGAEGHPRRNNEAEAALLGQPPNAMTFEMAAKVAAAAINPLVDANVSANYRRELLQILVFRALGQAAP